MSITLLLISTNFIPFETDEQEIAKTYSKCRFKPTQHYLAFKKGRLHYITVGDSTLPPLLLIHGSPGSWSDFSALITKTDLLEHYFVIAVDRPGYNHTSLPQGFTLEQQGEFIKPLITHYFKGGGIIMGHSYGGALALQTALGCRQKIDGLVIIAGTVAHPYQQPRWYNYVVKYSPVKWLLSDELITSNMEMWSLQYDLPTMEEQLASFSKKVAIIQGDSDILVDYRSAAYLEGKLPNATTTVFLRKGMNHFVIWSDQELVMQALDWVSS